MHPANTSNLRVSTSLALLLLLLVGMVADAAQAAVVNVLAVVVVQAAVVFRTTDRSRHNCYVPTSSMPGPRKLPREVLFALSNDALKMICTKVVEGARANESLCTSALVRNARACLHTL